MGSKGRRPSTNGRRRVPPGRGSRTFGLWSVALVFLMIASGLGTGVARAQTVGMRIAAAASVCSTPLHPPGTGPKEIRWCYTDLVGNKVRLWWDAAQPLAVQAANLAATEIPTTIWPRLIALWGAEPKPDSRTDSGSAGRPDSGGSAALDVSFYATTQPPTSTSTAGFWEPYEGCHSPQSGSLSLDATVLSKPSGTGRVLNPADVRNTLAHELTHAVQAAHPLDGGAGCLGQSSYRWMKEAVASWAPFVVYPQEPNHEWAHLLLDAPQKRLDLTTPANREYSGYLFFLFLQDAFGTGVPVAAWRELATRQPIDAIDQALRDRGGLSPNWARFTEWLWNGAPYDRLKTSYGLPRGAITVGTTPTGNANPVVNRTVGITMSATARSMAKSLPVVLEPLSQQYRKLVIGGSNIRTLTFRSPPITTHFTNSAILTTPGRAPATIAWRPPTTSQYICLDTQPVTEAILMFSAGSVTQGGSGNAWVHASNSCAAPSSLTWDSDPNVTGGGTVSGTVTINRPAPASGVELVVDAPSTVIVPAKIVVPAGQTRASFTVTTVPVDADTFPTVTISRAKELAIPGMAHGALRIRPATLKTLALPGRAQAGTTVAAGVGLNAPAGPGGVLVSLQAAMLTPPSTVNVEAGSNFAQFEVTADDTGCLSACERTGQLIANANGTVLAKTMVVIGPP